MGIKEKIEKIQSLLKKKKERESKEEIQLKKLTKENVVEWSDKVDVLRYMLSTPAPASALMSAGLTPIQAQEQIIHMIKDGVISPAQGRQMMDVYSNHMFPPDPEPPEPAEPVEPGIMDELQNL